MTTLSGDGSAGSISQDARTLVFNTFQYSTSRDLWALNLDDRQRRQLDRRPRESGQQHALPDGRWLAYSDEVEGYIFVTAFPGTVQTAAGRCRRPQQQVAAVVTRWS